MEFWEIVGAVMLGMLIYNVLDLGLPILWRYLFGK